MAGRFPLAFSESAYESAYWTELKQPFEYDITDVSLEGVGRSVADTAIADERKGGYASHKI